MNDMPEMLPTIQTLFVVLAFVAAVGLFFLFVFKRKPKKDITLFSTNDRQYLDGNEAEYFSYIKYDNEKNAIVLKQSQIFKKCVVTLIYKINNSIGMKRYTLNYASGDLFCGIQLKNKIDEFKVVLESIDGAGKKHEPIDNYFALHILYSIVVAVLFAVACFLYVFMCSFYLNDEWSGYAFYYVFVALVAIYVAVVIGGYFLGEYLSKKGVF